MVHIGDKVKVEHGEGIIIGKDLPLDKFWRWIFELSPGYRTNFTEFLNHRPCYLPKEVQLVTET